MEQLGDLLRASLTLASRPVVPLREELTFLDNYLAIEAARFEGRISAGVHVADGLLGYQVPSFLLQPLVENAIRHGVAPRLSGGRVEVTIARAGSSLEVRVRDDGVGLPDDWRLDRDARVGLGNIASRLEHLYGRGDLLRISRRATGGVDVELSLPLRSSAKSSTVEQTADAPA
jgi:two-component system LytT family sensor kinase